MPEEIPATVARVLVDDSSEAIVWFDDEGVVHWASPGLERQFGWVASQIVGTRLRLVTPAERGASDAAFLNAIESRAPRVDLRMQIMCPDGTTRWAEYTAHMLWEESRWLGMVLSVHDIDDLMKARQEALEGERRLRLLTESMKDVVWTLDVESLRFLYVSPSVEALRGYTPEEVMAQPMDAALTPAEASALRASMADNVAELEAGTLPFDRYITQEVEQPCKDGTTVWTEVVGRYHRNSDNGRIEFWAVTRDISERRAARDALAASEARYRLVAENSSDVVFRASADRVLEWVSPSVFDVLGWAPGDLVGLRPDELIHPDDHAALQSANAPVNEGRRGEYRARWRRPDGSYRWLGIVVRPLLDERGEVVGRVASGRDVQAEVEAEEALRTSERRFRLALESAPVGMAVVDLDRRFVEVNPALCRMLGCTEEWLLSRRVPDVIHAEDDLADLRMRAEVMSGRRVTATGDKRMLRRDGVEVIVEHSVGVLRDEDGTPVSYVSMFVDITEAHKAQARLRFLATHDALTALANRAEFTDRIERILSHDPRTGELLGVLFIDVDGLKRINDLHGHLAGDAMLVEIARRIAASVRSDDVVARIGGDEFVVALPSTRSIDDAVRVAGNIHESLVPPVQDGDLSIPVTVSIGVAVAKPGDSTLEVLGRADRALYRAKGEGRNRTVRYDEHSDAVD